VGITKSQPRIRIPPPLNKRRRKRRRGSSSLRIATGLGILLAAGLGYSLWRWDFLHAEAASAAILVAAPEAPDPVLPSSDPLSDIDIIEGKIGRGETVSTSLMARGIDVGRIQQIVEALRKEFDFRFTRAGDTYTLKLMRKTGEILSFEYRRSPLEVYVVTRGEDRGLTSFRRENAPTGQVARLGGAVPGARGGSLFSALEAAGESSALGGYLGEVFAWQLDLYEAQAGDRYRILVEKSKEGEEIRYGRILAAEYEGAGGAYRAFWYIDPDGRGDYVDEQGQYLKRPFLRSPLKFAPIGGDLPSRQEGEKGTEYQAPVGTPVLSVGDGIVDFAGERPGEGLTVILAHTDGYRSTYTHLSRLSPGLKKGVLVNQRRVLGYVGGSTRSPEGKTTGRLGFRLEQGGKLYDLATQPPSRGASVPPRHRSHFETFLPDQLAALAAVEIKVSKEEAAIPTPPREEAAPKRP
jgi:murein DD-endopeptidase MepM/ murein hydrolase activator NlpD